MRKYVTRLRLAAKFYEFGTNEETQIMDHVLKTCHSTRFRERLLEQNKLTFEKMLELGVNHDAVKGQVKLVEGKEPERAEYIEAFIPNRSKAKQHKFQSKQEVFKKKKSCFKCADDYPHTGECNINA